VKNFLLSTSIVFLLSGSLLGGCTSTKEDSTISLEEQERTRQHKKEFEKNDEENP